MPLHWEGDTFDFPGTHFDGRHLIARPRPVQDPIPIWIGGNARITLRRVAERAQGWMPLLGGPGLAATARTHELSGLDEVARSTAEMHDMRPGASGSGR